MRVGIAQINTVPGALDQTVERMRAQAQRAAEQGADLVVFPLAALDGIDLPPYADRPSYMADVAAAVATLVEQLPCRALVPIPLDDDNPETAFDVLLIEDGEVRPLCMAARMRSLTDEGGAPDAELPEFTVAGAKVVVALSYADLDLVDDYDCDADVALFLSGYPFALDDPSSAMGTNLDEARFIEDACTSDAWIVAVAPVGGYGEQVFCGASFVLDNKGNLRATLPAFEEALQVIEVGSDAAEESDQLPLAPEVFDAPFQLWQAVSLGIHDFVTKCGKTDVAVALDTTLASQVLLALASDALGPLHVHALVGAAAGSGAPACRDLARRLHVDQVDGPPAWGGFDAHDLDELALAALARDKDAVVLSSIDKTALAVGAAAGRVSCATLLPLGDVYRSDILDMAHVRNTISPLFRRVALGEDDAIDLPLRDGTLRHLVGEREITRLDETLLGYVEYDRSLSTLVEGEDDGREPLADVALRALRNSEAVRRSLAPVLVMSTHTLDETRFPLGMAWHDTHPEGLEDLMVGSVSLGFGDEAASEVPADDEGTRPDGTRHSSATPDLESTLALLRDLAEQGGFFPTDEGSNEGPLAPGAGLPGGGPAHGGTFFSEN